MAESGVGDEREEDNTFLFNFFDMKYFVVSPSTVDLAGLAYTVYFTMLKIFFLFFNFYFSGVQNVEVLF